MSLPSNFLALALLAIGLLAAARLLWTRPQRWRWRLLLQSGALLLVYMVLNPPPQPLPHAGTLTVLGAGWRDALTQRVGPGPPESDTRLGVEHADAPSADSQDANPQAQTASTLRPQAASRDIKASDGRSSAEAMVGQGPPYARSRLAEAPRDGSEARRAINASTELGPSAAVIALPEAEEPLPPGVQRTPDLATALRMRPEFSALRLFGRGLSLRDLQAARGRGLQFIAAPLPRGFVEIQHAAQATLGARIEVAARWNGAMPARVQLLAAAGEVLAERVSPAEAAPDGATASPLASALVAGPTTLPGAPAPGAAASDAVAQGAALRPAAGSDAAAADLGGPQAATSAPTLTAQQADRAEAQQIPQRDPDARPSMAGMIRLHTVARAAGPLSLRLRALDAEEQTLDVHDFRIEVTAPRAPKVLLLAAAPGPETRALRRWAVDAGLDFDSRIQFAPGLVQGGGALAPGADELAALDLLIIEERAWGAIGAGGRAAVLSEVGNGLGLLLRLTALPNPGLLAELREAGFVIERVPGETSAQARLAVAPTRLRQLPIRVSAPQAVAAVSSTEGEPLALWRARGLGRFGLLWLTDSYRLQAAGHTEVYGALWSGLTSELARAPSATPPAPILRLPQGQTQAWTGERIELCGLREALSLIAPDGTRLARVMPDAQGCAVALPELAGQYRLMDAGAPAPDLVVRDPGRESALHAADLLARTFAIAPARAAGEHSSGPLYVAGDFRPWLLALLAVLGLLWWLERPRLP